MSEPVVEPARVLYENEHYVVIAVAQTGAIAKHLGTSYTEYYEAINKETGVCELRHSILPEVLHCAAQFNIALKSKSWEWHDKQATRKPPSPGTVVSIVPPEDGETKH